MSWEDDERKRQQDDHFRRLDDLSRRAREDQKRTSKLIKAFRDKDMDEAYRVVGIPPREHSPAPSLPPELVGRLDVPARYLDQNAIAALLSIQLDPALSDADRRFLLLTWQWTIIDQLRKQNPQMEDELRPIREEVVAKARDAQSR
jgi:hypothetical protein